MLSVVSEMTHSDAHAPPRLASGVTGARVRNASHANAAKIARIENMSGRNDPGEGDWLGSAKGKPPVPLIKFGNGGGVKECQLMKLRERVRDIIVTRINLTNSIHRSHLNSRSSFVFRHVRTDHFPSVALMPSQTAPTKPVTITVMTALKV